MEHITRPCPVSATKSLFGSSQKTAEQVWGVRKSAEWVMLLLRGVITLLPVLLIYLEVRCRKSLRNAFVCFVKICVIKAILQGVNDFFFYIWHIFRLVWIKFTLGDVCLTLTYFIKDVVLNEFLRFFFHMFCAISVIVCVRGFAHCATEHFEFHESPGQAVLF
jgi:hypothetical protein